MASDLLLGFILGVTLVGFLLPMKGILFTLREQKKQIAFLTGPKAKEKAK